MNKLTKEQFLTQSVKGRKNDLAVALFEEQDTEEMKTAGFAPMIIIEMAHRIRREVEGMEDFRVSVSDTPAKVAEVVEEVKDQDAPVANAPVANAAPVVHGQGQIKQPTPVDVSPVEDLSAPAAAPVAGKQMTNEPLESSCCEG